MDEHRKFRLIWLAISIFLAIGFLINTLPQSCQPYYLVASKCVIYNATGVSVINSVPDAKTIASMPPEMFFYTVNHTGVIYASNGQVFTKYDDGLVKLNLPNDVLKSGAVYVEQKGGHVEVYVLVPTASYLLVITMASGLFASLIMSVRGGVYFVKKKK